MRQLYEDRRDAGRQLARALNEFAGRPDVLVLALPRGGVPVAFEVASALDVPLDVFIVRKLGMPGHEEFGIGAIASGGVRVVDQTVLRSYGIDEATLDRIAGAEREELERRERLYRDDRPFPDLHGRTVILVDDGLATGSTMRAAIAALRAEQPRELVIAVPVGARETCEALSREADLMICLWTPEPFYAVGLWYRDFEQTTDAEVHDLLERAATRAAGHR